MKEKTKAFLEELIDLCVRYECDIIPITDKYGEPFILVSDGDDTESVEVRFVCSSGSIKLSDRAIIDKQ